MKPYRKYVFKTDDETIRALLIEGLDTFEGFEESDDELAAYVVQDEEGESLEKARRFLSSFGFELPAYECETIAWQNWNATWEAQYEPTAVDDYVLCYPTHRRGQAQEYAARFRYLLEIEPRMAFGTGRHETTRLCLRALKRLEDEIGLSGKRVLDVGCGTGILGLTALRAGANVGFVDCDPIAVEDTFVNIRINGMANRNFDLRLGTARSFLPQNFDVLLVNLTRNAVIAEKDVYYALLAPGGTLVASGFLAADAPTVCEALANFELVSRLKENEWSCLIFSRRS
ncbi:MAG: 50S ribosomal protein L11 methyltransferase [Bacteroidia bacterium]|nr:50S ribosomal protein L11 methyltransferase [Bacteroidia bacterium]MDW8333014.1 50S ribosomal protein L11 methyltransferase [Bacteroidia bacterium]